MRTCLLTWVFVLLLVHPGGGACAQSQPLTEQNTMLDTVVFYASFDQAVEGDFGGGELKPRTRFDHESKEGEYVFKDGINSSIFQITEGEGVQGGALKATDVLPRRGRIFFPAQGNLPYRKTGWSGSVSFWIKTNPNTMLKTRFCDPVQITEKGATNGGLWVDFPDSTPRDFRLGAFPSEGDGRQRVSESSQDPPLVVVKEVDFKATDWRHVAFTWSNFDTGEANAKATLYIDGKAQGEIENRNITMDWNIDKTGIYFAVGYIGLIDEFAVFDRPLTVEEINQLHQEPGMLAVLKKSQ